MFRLLPRYLSYARRGTMSRSCSSFTTSPWIILQIQKLKRFGCTGCLHGRAHAHEHARIQPMVHQTRIISQLFGQFNTLLKCIPGCSEQLTRYLGNSIVSIVSFGTLTDSTSIYRLFYDRRPKEILGENNHEDAVFIKPVMKRRQRSTEQN